MAQTTKVLDFIFGGSDEKPVLIYTSDIIKTHVGYCKNILRSKCIILPRHQTPENTLLNQIPQKGNEKPLRT